MIFRNIFLIICILLTGLSASAQTAATVKATLDKNRLLIGEQATLRIEVQIPEKEPIRFVSVDSLEHFEWIGKPVMDTVGNDNGTLLTGLFTIISFDSGHWVIPSFELSGGLRTDSIPVDVVFSDFDPKAPYHDIKDVLEADPEKKKNEWWWYAAAGGFLLILLLVFILRRKKKPVPVMNTEPKIVPLEEALAALHTLQSANLEVKQYHTRLADIFRLYIFRKKGILSLQETTDDLVVQLSELGLDRAVQDELAQALRLGDFVKFAKFVPATAENEKAFMTIKRSIERIDTLN